MDFGVLSEINPIESISFQKIFLTFDIDWASDEVLEYSIGLLERANVKATWFVTHKTPLLERLRGNPLFELGIHPNFNPLLEGDFSYGRDYKEVLRYFLDIVPEAKTMRSHCLGISSRILSEAKKLGITHESNLCIPMMAHNSSGGGAFCSLMRIGRDLLDALIIGRMMLLVCIKIRLRQARLQRIPI